MAQPMQNPLAYFSPRAGEHPEPLTPEQLSQITHARHRYKKVGRAIRVATFDAWTTAIFAALSLIFCVFSFSLPGILVGLGLAAVSYNSFRGLKQLEQLNLEGPKLLGKNQILLGCVLLLYALWNLYLVHTGKIDSDLSPETRDQLAQVGMQGVSDLVQYCYYAVYGGLAVFAIVVQGLTSYYYSSRGRHIEEYQQRTADWVLQMQKMGFKL